MEVKRKMHKLNLGLSALDRYSIIAWKMHIIKYTRKLMLIKLLASSPSSAFISICVAKHQIEMNSFVV